MCIVMVRLCVVLLALLALAGTARAEPVLDSEENTLWTLLNDYRQANGVQPDGLNDQRVAAAEWMSSDMAANDYCSHTDSLGRDARQRMVAFGYVHNTTTGENIVCGVGTARATFDLLRGSPEHDANMLGPFWAVGIARVYDEASTYGWYWAIDFGGRGPAWFPATPTPVPTPVLAATATPTPTPSPMPTPVPNGFPSLGTKP